MAGPTFLKFGQRGTLQSQNCFCFPSVKGSLKGTVCFSSTPAKSATFVPSQLYPLISLPSLDFGRKVFASLKAITFLPKSSDSRPNLWKFQQKGALHYQPQNCVCLPSERRSTLKGKNLLPFGTCKTTYLYTIPTPSPHLASREVKTFLPKSSASRPTLWSFSRRVRCAIYYKIVSASILKRDPL